MKILVMVLVAVLSSACSEEGEMVDQIEIYYVPIGVETYVPMTPEIIQESATSVGQITLSDRNFKKLMVLLESSSEGQFECDSLRAKIVFPGNNIIYIDNYGGVRLAESETRKLNEASLQAVRKILEKLTAKR